MVSNKTNYQIKARNGVLLIDDSNTNHGVVTFKQAIEMAQEKGLDLVQINFQDPPVCKITDYGKMKYEENKKLKKNSKAGRLIVKEVQLTPRIEAHDIEVKKKHVEDFIQHGYKVIVSMRFRGRENTHVDIGYKIIEQFKLENCTVTGPTLNGNTLTLILMKNSGSINGEN